MSNFTEKTVRINADERVLEKLNRLKKVSKDEHGEFIWAMVNGESFKMYFGQERALPGQFADALIASEWIPLDEACPLCQDKKGKPIGFVAGNICGNCKGNKWIDLNETVPLYKETATRNTKQFSVRDLQPPVDAKALATA